MNGVALLCRPGPGAGDRAGDVATVRAVLRKEVGITVEDLSEGDTGAFINGNDVLFTGSEIFVGVGAETNTEGALCVANTWPEYPCTPVQVGRQLSCLLNIFHELFSVAVGRLQAFERQNDDSRGGCYCCRIQ